MADFTDPLNFGQPSGDDLIQAMRRMGLVGQLSGDKVIAPMGQGLEQQAGQIVQNRMAQAQFARQLAQNQAQADFWKARAASLDENADTARQRAETERQKAETQRNQNVVTKDVLGNVVTVPKYGTGRGAPLRAAAGAQPAPAPAPGAPQAPAIPGAAPRAPSAAPGGLGGALLGTGATGVHAIAQAVKDGRRPPDLSGLSRQAASAVSAELAQDPDYNLSTAQTDWKATQRHVASLNGPQQLRLRQAAYTAQESLGNIENLYSEWLKVGPASGYRILNKAALAAAKQVPGRTGEVARALDMNIADLTAELGNVYMGGNSPTDHALSLAKTNLSSDWSEGQFREALKQARLNIGYRIKSIENAGVAGASEGNKYAPKEAPAQASAAPAAAPVSQADQDAINWAKANPNDPRSAKILALHGVK